MPRIKTGPSRRRAHKKVFSLAKGFRMARNRLYKVAHEAVIHAGAYAFNGRKEKKQNFRKLWIVKISAALANQDKPVSYSIFTHQLKLKNISLNRKSLSQLATKLPNAFSAVFQFTQK